LKFYFIAIFFLLGGWIKGQSLNLSFNHLSREGGLSNNNAASFLADSKGFLWVGTFNGLNRFDGSTCKVFKPFNSSISGVSIANIIEDKNSDLWFTSESGLNHYSRLKNSFDNIDCIKDGKARQYFPFYVDNQNRIWFIVAGKGIYVYNPINKIAKFITQTSSDYAKVGVQPFQEVKKIFYSDNQSGLGLFTLEEDKVVRTSLFFDGKKQPALNLARYFFVENDSLVWLTNTHLGLVKFNYRNLQYQTFNTFQGKSIGTLTSVFFRPNSTQLFAGSNDLGVLIFDTKQLKFIQRFQHNPTNPNSLRTNWAEDIFIDKNQNLFINLLGWGIDFTNLNTSNTLHWLSKDDVQKYKLVNNVIAYSFIHKNKISVKLQQGGIVILDTNGKLVEKIKEYPAADNMVYGVDSTIFACGLGEVLILDDDFKVIQHIPIKNKAEEFIHSIAVVSADELIAGASTGFYSIKKQGKIYAASLIEELNQPQFHVNLPLYYDKTTEQLFFSSNWWNNFYILKKRLGKWKVQTSKKLEANVFNIIPDVDDGHKIWLCTNRGLWKFDVRTHQYDIWDEAKGLPDNSVTTYIPAKNGDFWLVTNRGISFYNKKLNVFKNFTEKDGATSTEYDWYGSFKLPDGRMMFAGLDGITVISPKELNSKTPPRLYFTDIKVNEKSLVSATYIGENNSINLKPDESSFSIDFVGIDYAKPESIKLQYQLEGFDNEWITVKNPANIHFSNVPENTYNFKIRSLSDNGQITAEKSLKITIEAPFWRTWWFRLIEVALILGLVYAFYRYRINQLLQLQAVRNRISTDLHDEIGATLSGIGILSTIAKKQVAENHPAYSLLGRITDDALTIGNSIDDIVWSINPKNDELLSIIARMSRHAAELFDAKGIDYQIITPDMVEDIKLSMEQRRDVYLIFKEAVNNLIKYANCSKAMIEIGFENGKFQLTILDNGVGFDVSQTTTRNGIKNMKNRAEKLHGKLTIDAKIDTGTKVMLAFSI
jgi:signal transduction histidine kinase/ligand-binding sensor domain-containing protein